VDSGVLDPARDCWRSALVMLNLPGDGEAVTLELVHNPALGAVESGNGFSHIAVQVQVSDGKTCNGVQAALSYTWWSPLSTGRDRIAPVTGRSVGSGVCSPRLR
jgi:hypothetical protein